jgi:sec-independent protein translocase protein TatB
MDFGFFGIGTWELMVIGLIALLVLGPKQMILLARKAGELLHQFQMMWQEASKTIDQEIKALESETGDVSGLGKDIQALADEMKSALNVNLPSSGNNSNTIRPPTQPPPPSVWVPSPPPPGNGATAESKPSGANGVSADSTTASTPPKQSEDSSAGPTEQPAADARPDEPKKKYSAWSNKNPAE